MDINTEREEIQQKCLRLSRCVAVVRGVPMPSIDMERPAETEMPPEEKVYLYRRITQAAQNYVLVQFASSILEKALKLMEESEEIREIGRESLDGLHDFLDHYIDLFEQEYECCQMADGENSPLE